MSSLYVGKVGHYQQLGVTIENKLKVFFTERYHCSVVYDNVV